MAQDIGGVGSKVSIIAVPTFPQGFTITEFASDADPVVIEDIEVANTELGVNGDMVSWHRAVTIPVELNVIPNSEADKNLQILVATNRVAKNKVAISDDITMIVSYADGSIKTLTGGVIIAGNVASSITTEGKIRTKNYRFQFANII